MCAVVAPEIFGADDYGNAVILVEGDLTEPQQMQARRGAGNCPEQAVIIDE